MFPLLLFFRSVADILAIMTVHRFAEMTWPEVDALEPARTVALLPLGATEAHGPHLPLSTDVILAEGMAEAGAHQLAEASVEVLLLPPIVYTAASFARGFAGTLSVRPKTVTALIVDLVKELERLGLRRVALVNAHFDPQHVGSIHDAVRQLEDSDIQVIFPDVTRRSLAVRLTDEFRSGACHAGCYEGSMVLARRPDLVRTDLMEELTPVHRSLSDAIRNGQSSFEEAGGIHAYFGDPAAATEDEGNSTYGTLGEILAEAVLESFERVN